ncbi:MAG: hypothetical protein KC643_33095 [Nitrospira sp.]|nr:hypothetical protein [Nitrospira sp.]
MKKTITWALIRNVGNLQVLTRASYLMLIVVPILAALWPGVRLVINQYNQTLISVSSHLESASRGLEYESKKIEEILKQSDIGEFEKVNFKTALAKNAHDIVATLKAQVNEVLEDFKNKTIEKETLPSVWAWVFFAALSVFFAHTFYEVGAPEIVRKNSMEEYVYKQLDEFTKFPSNNSVKESGRLIFNTQNTKNKRDFLLNAGEWESLDKSIEWVLDEREYKDFMGLVPEERSFIQEAFKKSGRDIIELGSKIRYRESSQFNPFLISLTLLLYSIGIILILVVIKHQASVVTTASGWFGGS